MDDAQPTVPYGYCRCGCGGKTSLARQTRRGRGQVKGQPVKYIRGHVRTPPVPVAERFWHSVDKTAGHGPAGECWHWTAGCNEFGYGSVSVERRPTRAHRVSWAMTYGPIPDGACVLHRCDNPPCVNPEHLFLGTKADNTADMIAKGRAKGAPRGELHPACRLTADDVRAIRRAYSGTRGEIKVLAQRYGVSHGAVAHLLSGRTWSHLA